MHLIWLYFIIIIEPRSLPARFRPLPHSMKTTHLIQLDLRGEHREVAVIHLTRKAKRNAINDTLILALRDLFEKLPSSVRAAVLHGEGDHFCAGLDLSEL